MSEARISRLSQIQDPALRSFTESLASGVCAAGFKAAAHHANPKQFALPAGDTLERAFLDYLRSRPLAVQQKIAAKALPIVTNKQIPGMEGLDLSSATPVLDQITTRLKLGALTTAAGSRVAREGAVIEEGAPGFRRQDAPDMIRMEILAVKCVDESAGFAGTESGTDEMAIGGLMIDAAGNVTKIAQIKLGDFGKDGAKRTYNPVISLGTMDLRSGTAWPKTFSWILNLVELDNGAFPAFLEKVYKFAKDKVLEFTKNKIEDKSFLEIIAGAIAAVLDKVLGWVKEWWEDDVFKPMTFAFDFDSADARFANGKSETGPMWQEIRGHDATYRLYVNAKLALASEAAAAGGAIVYDDANYLGKAVKLPVGHYTAAQLQARGVANDTISSVKVGAGLRMIGYQDDNFAGMMWMYTGAQHHLTAGMSNKISSLVIEPVYVMLFKDANYRGESPAFGPGRYDVAQLKIGNDQASSVLVPPGYKVTLYRDAGFKGAKKVLTADTTYVGADFDNVTSSLIVELAW